MEYGVIGSVFIFPIHRDNSGALQIATTMEREKKNVHTHTRNDAKKFELGERKNFIPS